jgi:hypothetical protein
MLTTYTLIIVDCDMNVTNEAPCERGKINGVLIDIILN